MRPDFVLDTQNCCCCWDLRHQRWSVSRTSPPGPLAPSAGRPAASHDATWCSSFSG